MSRFPAPVAEMSKAEILNANQEFYLEYAREGYDRDRAHFYKREARRVGRDLEWIENRRCLSDSCVADIGCGTGFYACEFAARGVGSFYCVDLNSVFLDETRRKLTGRFPALRELVTIESDFEQFIDKLPSLPRRPDVYVFGTVLQYVPDYQALLQRLVNLEPQATYYVTGTRLPAEIQRGALETPLAIIDFQLHKLIHDTRETGRMESRKITLEVSDTAIQDVFTSSGFEIYSHRYSTFHTVVGELLHRGLNSVIRDLGSVFTFIADNRSARTRSDV